MNSLYDELKNYSDKDLYPCHMPGHKRHALGAMSEEYASIDLTEVDSVDDLHDPEGIILESQKFAAQVLGADETFFLINGSTAGVLAAVCASVRKGGKLLLVFEMLYDKNNPDKWSAVEKRLSIKAVTENGIRDMLQNAGYVNINTYTKEGTSWLCAVCEKENV